MYGEKLKWRFFQRRGAMKCEIAQTIILLIFLMESFPDPQEKITKEEGL